MRASWFRRRHRGSCDKVAPMASGQEELLFGRLALHYKLITAGQLDEVHGLHALAEGRRPLPEMLVEMGYLTQRQVDQLLLVQRDYLQKRRDAQAAVPPPAAPAAAAPGDGAAAAAVPAAPGATAAAAPPAATHRTTAGPPAPPPPAA